MLYQHLTETWYLRLWSQSLAMPAIFWPQIATKNQQVILSQGIDLQWHITMVSGWGCEGSWVQISAWPWQDLQETLDPGLPLKVQKIVKRFLARNKVSPRLCFARRYEQNKNIWSCINIAWVLYCTWMGWEMGAKNVIPLYITSNSSLSFEANSWNFALRHLKFIPRKLRTIFFKFCSGAEIWWIFYFYVA